jgi:hypothetical protein
MNNERGPITLHLPLQNYSGNYLKNAHYPGIDQLFGFVFLLILKIGHCREFIAQRRIHKQVAVHIAQMEGRV